MLHSAAAARGALWCDMWHSAVATGLALFKKIYERDELALLGRFARARRVRRFPFSLFERARSE